MEFDQLIIGLAGVIATASPIVFAVLGETLTERAGVINLSVNGMILLTAMSGFAVAATTGSVLLGFAAGMLIGALVGAVVAFTSITLRQSQVAIGFVLALMTRDLAYYLGSPFTGQNGPRVPPAPIPLLSDIPVVGPLFFDHDLVVYLSFILIAVTYLWLFRTAPGLVLQGVGERPASAYVRGVDVNRQRYFYTILGGALVGLAGPAYSLSIKAGWQGTISGLDGIGWIALAITIFGGWNPLRAATGAYFFALLQWLSLVLQPVLTGIPSQVLQVAPFPLMILTLLLVNFGSTEWVRRRLSALPEDQRRAVNALIRRLNVSPPSALGTNFRKQ
ncbi:MAG: ABC transporter permease [Anaerolineae bacterium]|nr:ABC transporter permease [Anaerolineae bacterium]NUQ05910.1 ABC transporter permease [Anaerolineae bacterium]